MQIPEHWAEARVVGKVAGRDRVIRRFGWSETSAADAEQMARQRAAQALADLQQGKRVAPREQKLPYGGDGMPIREQVLARDGDLVVTRCSYGARCLNQPDVLFADIDLAPRLGEPAERAFGLLLRLLPVVGIAAAVLLFATHAWFGCSGLLFAVAAPILVHHARGRLRRRPAAIARNETRALERVEAVVASVPRGRFALYRTPAGLRLLALHATFQPGASATQTLLRDLGTDPAFAQMCELQACFRARVSGKPWRMQVRHIRPNPGIWPVHQDRRALRDAWIADYEAVAPRFAACRHLHDLGTGPIDPRCAQVQRLHDELSRARTDLPLA